MSASSRALLGSVSSRETPPKSHSVMPATLTPVRRATSAWPDGRPHMMPVWGMWQDDAFWFSSSNHSRKARNLGSDPRCTVATGDPENPVVLEGLAARVTEPDVLQKFLDWENAKYAT